MNTTFADLGVPADLDDALRAQGITSPFEIQMASIPDALAGRDVLGRAPTGSGKTLAFGLPLLVHLGRGEPRRPRGLILSPTRELAEQIRRELEPLAAARNRRVLSVYGGVGFGAQVDGLRKGADLVVACPGRLLDLIEQGEVALDEVDRVVVDEADRMADMGFLPAVREILDLTSPKRQTVMFSATLDRDVQVLIDHYQNDPVTHQVGEVEPDLSQVTHRFLATRAADKLALAADVIDELGPTVVFCRTRHGVDRVARQLKAAGIRAGWIHGGRTQSQRNAALHAFTTGRVQALVATDVAARGIHVDGVAGVIHFDPPADAKDYVHRSGRTARAGAGGVVVSFVNSDQLRAAERMMKEVGLPSIEMEEAVASDRADHIDMDVRSRRTGRPLRDGSRATARRSPADPDREKRTSVDSADDGPTGADEWATSTSKRSPGPKRRSRTHRAVERQGPSDGTGDGTAHGGTERNDSAGGNQPSTRSARRVPDSERSGRKRPTGKKRTDPKRATKRSGKPRPKNKSRSKNKPRR